MSPTAGHCFSSSPEVYPSGRDTERPDGLQQSGRRLHLRRAEGRGSDQVCARVPRAPEVERRPLMPDVCGGSGGQRCPGVRSEVRSTLPRFVCVPVPVLSRPVLVYDHPPVPLAHRCGAVGNRRIARPLPLRRYVSALKASAEASGSQRPAVPPVEWQKTRRFLAVFPVSDRCPLYLAVFWCFFHVFLCFF